MGKKDPNKPKGAKSAYTYFTEEIREEKKANGEAYDIGTISKESSDKWKTMDEDDRKPYAKLAEKDKKRHLKEMESYVPPSDSDSEDEAPKKKKKKMKDPNAPKRNQSAYFLFSNKNRETVKQELGGTTKITEIASALGARWRGMTDKDKEPYEALAKKDKERYQKDMLAYNSR